MSQEDTVVNGTFGIQTSSLEGGGNEGKGRILVDHAGSRVIFSPRPSMDFQVGRGGGKPFGFKCCDEARRNRCIGGK